MISVIILTLNSLKFIEPCLDSILNQKVDEIEIIVVDNGSKDGTVSFIKGNYPEVILILNKTNQGAAKARNQGINIAKGKWILTLDCDVVLEQGFLLNMEQAVKEAALNVGMIQSKILQPDHKTIYSTGISVSFLRRFHDIGKGKKDTGKFDKAAYIFGACSAAALYSKDMLDEIKQGADYFDESFFFLFEDVDLAWRAQRKGYKAIFCPSAVCYHQGNSSATPGKIRQYLCLRNRYYVLLKNESIKNYILSFLFYDLPRLSWILITNPFALKAIKDAFIYKTNLGRIKIELLKSRTGILVSIIIVTSGAKDYLWHCLDSVRRQSYPNLEVMVIDNSLNPDFSAKICESFSFVRLYSNPQNLYYGVSLNKGIALSQGEFILDLNDDVVLDQDFIHQALKGFSVKNNIGMASGKILRRDGLTLDSTGLFLSFWYSAKERGYGQKDVGKFEKPGFIFGVSGSVAFYRKKMLEEIKQGYGDYFDPAFRMFYEDLDISWRANNCGWRAYYIPTAKAFHVRGGSFRPENGLNEPFARKYLNHELHCDLIKNRYLTILKNAHCLSFVMHLVPIILYDFCAWGYVLFFRPKVAKIFLRNLKCYFKLRFG